MKSKITLVLLAILILTNSIACNKNPVEPENTFNIKIKVEGPLPALLLSYTFDYPHENHTNLSNVPLPKEFTQQVNRGQTVSVKAWSGGGKLRATIYKNNTLAKTIEAMNYVELKYEVQ